MFVEKQFISADRFLEIVEQPQYDDRIVDLVDGEIIDMLRPTAGHGEIVSWLVIIIGNHVLKHDLGRMSSGDAGFILECNPEGRDTVRGLDIAFISKT